MSMLKKLERIKKTKEEIKASIINKGQKISDSDTFASYAKKIDAITGGGGNSNNCFMLSVGKPIEVRYYLDTEFKTYCGEIEEE